MSACAPRSIGDEGGVHERSAEELAPAESCSVRLSNDSDFYIERNGGRRHAWPVVRAKIAARAANVWREVGSES